MWTTLRRRLGAFGAAERRATSATRKLAQPRQPWSVQNASHVDLEGPNGPRRGRDWTIADGRYVSTDVVSSGVDLDGSWWFPGLINAHDHLGFSNAPFSAPNTPYPSMTAWAADAQPLAEHGALAEALRVPEVERLWIGMLRNLLTGATTVVHHDPGHDVLASDGLVAVPAIDWAHSLPFGQTRRLERGATGGSRSFVLHLSEGTDAASRDEYDHAVRLGLIRSGSVAVHGLALSAAQLQDLATRGGALAWCPTSNRRLYGEAMPWSRVPEGLPVALGTDSPLTDGPLLLDEARAALAEGLPPERLLPMLTVDAASVFQFDRVGRVAVGYRGDGFAIERRTRDPMVDLLDTAVEDVLFVSSGGRPLVIDERVTTTLPEERALLVFRGRRKRVTPEVLAPIRSALIDGHTLPPEWARERVTARGGLD